jgi:hypothetical protein
VKQSPSISAKVEIASPCFTRLATTTQSNRELRFGVVSILYRLQNDIAVKYLAAATEVTKVTLQNRGEIVTSNFSPHFPNGFGSSAW